MRINSARIVEAGLLTALIVTSSVTAPAQVPRATPPAAATSAATAAAVPSTATIRGSVFYNDRRSDGLFDARRDKSGNPGQRCDASGVRNGQPCSLNWLGGKYMVVDVIERDLFIPPRDAPSGCRTEEVIGSATVNYDGSFVATFGANDPCTGDTLQNLAIELRVRLRFCNSSYCFSINRSPGNPYWLSHPGATAANPLRVRPGGNVTVATMNYSTAADPSQPNNDSIAANYYASIVDTVLALHKDSTIPFYSDEFGEIEYIFPSTQSSTATTRSATEVAVSTFQSQPNGSAFAWVDGKTPAHEYGHVMMLRAWDGAYGFDGIGISAGSDTIAPSQQIAFKEGWAEFIPRFVFADTRGCSRSGYDDNSSTALPGALGEGATWRDNITKALCDWYDDRDDDDTRLAGGGDDFTAEDIYSMWYNLRRMKVDAARYGGRVTNPGLWFCDYVRYYLDVRKSAAEVGAASHAEYEDKIRDLIYNNNIACSMSAP